MSSLENKTCIVTGASKGFGLAISKALLAAGANVGMLARGDDTLQQVVAELGSGRAVGFSCDVAKAAEVKKVFEQVKNHFGSLNAVCNTSRFSVWLITSPEKYFAIASFKSISSVSSFRSCMVSFVILFFE